MSETSQPSAANSPHTGPQYLVDSVGNRIAVVLDLATYERLIERLEDYEDAEWAREYEARKAAGLLTPDERDTIPLDQAIAEIEAEWATVERKAG